MFTYQSRSQTRSGSVVLMCSELRKMDRLGFEDPRLLDRATDLNRVLFTQDKGFLREANRRHERAEAFYGLVYAHQLNVTIGECVNDLELIAKSSDLQEWIGRVEHLPL